MAKKKKQKSRYLSPNSYYHIFNRGIRKKEIFLSICDYERFVKKLNYYNDEFPDLTVHAYCLMPNHYHFLLKTGSDSKDLQSFMLRLMTSYSKYFNIRYKLAGTIYQGRYKSKYLETFKDVRRTYFYIKNNPIEANLCRKPETYKWLWLDTLMFNSFEKENKKRMLDISKK